MKNFKNKKLYVRIIVVLALIMIPISVYGYSSIEYKNSVNRARNLVDEEKYDDAISTFNEITKSYFGKKNIDKVNNYIKNVKKLKENKKVFDEALKLLNDGKYLEVIEGFKKIPKEDTKRYEVAGKKIEVCKNLYMSLNVENAKNEAKANNYDSAISLLALVLKLDDTNKEAISLKYEFIKEKDEAELKAKQEAELKAKQEAEAKAKQEASEKAKKEAAAINIVKPQSAYAPTQVSGNEAIKNEFKKMGFVFQSDTIASYTKDGMNVALEYVEDGGEKGSCWAISTSASNYGYEEERLITSAMVVILGRDKASNNLTYIHYALGTSESFETPSIKTLIYNQKLYVFIYIPK